MKRRSQKIWLTGLRGPSFLFFAFFFRICFFFFGGGVFFFWGGGGGDEFGAFSFLSVFSFFFCWRGGFSLNQRCLYRIFVFGRGWLEVLHLFVWFNLGSRGSLCRVQGHEFPGASKQVWDEARASG